MHRPAAAPANRPAALARPEFGTDVGIPTALARLSALADMGLAIEIKCSQATARREEVTGALADDTHHPGRSP